MMTGQDNRDAAAEARLAAAAAPAAVAVPVVMPDGPPTMDAIWRLRKVYPYVAPWRGPYAPAGEPIEGTRLRALFLDADGNLGYEIVWKEGGPGAVVRRQHGFRTNEGLRGAAQWELDRLEKLLA